MRPVELTWAGGEHQFLLRIAQLRALQDACDAGPGTVLKRLLENDWFVDDVISVIRFGLEGGGIEKALARKITMDRVDDAPLATLVPVAQAVLAYSLFGDDEDDPVGKPQAGTEPEAEPDREASGDSRKSSAPEPSSDSPPPKLVP